VDAIINRQVSDAQRELVCSHVISNAGTWEDLFQQVTGALVTSGASPLGDKGTAAALLAAGPLASGPAPPSGIATPTDEIVTHVNEKDEVLGSVPRSTMRSQNLWHRATFIFVRRSGGEFIIQKRTDTKDYMPGAWDVPTGGVVAYNEEWMPSAQRELQEELGIHGKKAGLRWCFKFPYEDEHTKCWAGVLDCVWDGPLELQEAEVAATAEVAKDGVYRMQAKGATFTPDGLYALQLYQEWIKRGRPNMPILPGNKEQQVWANRAASDFGGSPLLAELTGDEKARTPVARGARASGLVGALESSGVSWARLAVIGAAVLLGGALVWQKQRSVPKGTPNK
jgi:8-oxo-dGTP pyrophosphatase MutT (NUDIX family)